INIAVVHHPQVLFATHNTCVTPTILVCHPKLSFPYLVVVHHPQLLFTSLSYNCSPPWVIFTTLAVLLFATLGFCLPPAGLVCHPPFRFTTHRSCLPLPALVHHPQLLFTTPNTCLPLTILVCQPQLLLTTLSSSSPAEALVVVNCSRILLTTLGSFLPP
ncbi:hypothetical protein LOTGIDRAFT_140626, partial [Lottia gigantea]